MLLASLKYLFVFFIFAILEFPTAYAQDTEIVYSRCERTTTTYDLTGTVTIKGQTQTITRTMDGLDIYDVLPDVTNFLSGFTAPCDLVFRDSNGIETVIYDCSSTSTQNQLARLWTRQFHLMVKRSHSRFFAGH